VALTHVLVIVIAASSLVAGCRRDAAPAAAQEEGPEPLSVTRWTEKTELFAEYPTLVVGQTSRFAIHLTTLEPFRAVTEGAVEVQLRGADGQIERFTTNGSSRPGIFGVDVKPTRGGTRDLVITWRSPKISDTHVVGPVEVYADATAVAAAAPPEPETEAISFLKEQQWTLDFATAVVQQKPIRASLRVPGELVPAPGGEADVLAPFDGRLASVVAHASGAAVSRGQELARIQPPPGAPADLPQLERGRAQAASALELASRDRERAERLVAAGAAPQKRLDEARAAQSHATAAFGAAEAQLVQFNASRTADGASNAGLFVIRAPIGGVIVRRDAAAGMNVAAGTALFHVVDPALVQVIGHVPESQLSRARLATGAQIEIPDGKALMPAGRLVSRGQVLDPQSRTLPITFAADNRLLGLAVGQSVFLHLLLDQTSPAPVIPASAIVDDAGRPIVFVQVEGESFERRPVSLGAREGELVQVTSGVKPGERVVTTGAFLVRLASLSTSVPAHGHVH
jgi:cobalt-zinc-cadmium efflux system membrane fusion protein